MVMTSSRRTTRRPDTSRESTWNAPATFLRRALAPGRSVWATVLLRRVAVPVRLAQDHIGDAILLAARTRPKFIGGERAHYDEALKDGYPEF